MNKGKNMKLQSEVSVLNNVNNISNEALDQHAEHEISNAIYSIGDTIFIPTYITMVVK